MDALHCKGYETYRNKKNQILLLFPIPVGLNPLGVVLYTVGCYNAITLVRVWLLAT